MLLTDQQKIRRKQVALVTRNPVVTKLLGAIMEGWGFRLMPDPADAAVVFVERGLDPPVAADLVVWLTPMPIDDKHHIEIPIVLNRLYAKLEQEFFPSPRRHVRVPLDFEADLQVDGEWLEARLISLSDRGGRIRCARELSRQQQVILETRLGERMVRIPAEVLYCVPAGDSPGREGAQVGLLFKPLDEDLCLALRMYIERRCVERACAALDLALNDTAVSWLVVENNPWAALD